MLAWYRSSNGVITVKRKTKTLSCGSWNLVGEDRQLSNNYLKCQRRINAKKKNKDRDKRIRRGDDDGGQLCSFMWESWGKPGQEEMMFEQTAEGVP